MQGLRTPKMSTFPSVIAIIATGAVKVGAMVVVLMPTNADAER